MKLVWTIFLYIIRKLKVKSLGNSESWPLFVNLQKAWSHNGSDLKPASMVGIGEWTAFFLEAGISLLDTARDYAITFERNKMKVDLLPDLDLETFRCERCLGDVKSGQGRLLHWTQWITAAPKYTIKIPHTGDKASLDRCR